MREVNSQNDVQESTHRRTRWLVNVIASIVACAGVMTLGMWTYGTTQPIHITQFMVLPSEQDSRPDVTIKKPRNALVLAMPDIPSDQAIEKLLNDTMPRVCEGCDEKPLVCLHRYFIDKRVWRGPNYDYLALDVKTGHIDRLRTYRVLLDLRNDNAIIVHGGAIKKTACRDIIEEYDDDESAFIVQPGYDPVLSTFLTVP